MSEVVRYLENIPAKQKEDIHKLYELIRDWQPSLKIKMWRSMGQDIIGFGQASFRYSDGRLGSWFVIGLATCKNYSSLYIWGFDQGRYLLEVYGTKLGRVKCGKSCLNFKNFRDLELSVLRRVVALAVEQATQDTP